ncbi:MAG TPA: hypothetical protein VMS00_09140 [Acidimicrobiales bacterium]|nr:hypothetical protein [Acidimicrobiales bacterium]
MRQPLAQRRGSWRGARPELGIAAVALLASAAAAYAVASTAATVVVVVVFAVIAMGVVSRLLPAPSGATTVPEIAIDRRLSTGRSFTYWRLQSQLKDGMASRSAYETALGPHLEHLLAARLSERHGVTLYGQPDAARRILCANDKDLDLWPWVDPVRSVSSSAEGPGIPAKTLARLLQRMEEL